jgi:putative transposase
MARKPRAVVPGLPLHIVQRGNNRQPVFFGERDYVHYLVDLSEASAQYGCAVHAYVLMTNHVHLLVTPSDAHGPALLMQQVGRRYVSYLNRRHGRAGALWDGRFKSALIDTDAYFLACSRYIEMNPVRAGMVADPAEYRWSSYRANGLGHGDALLSPHPLYQSLGASAASRRAAYRALFRECADEKLTEAIRVGTRTGVPVGDGAFAGRLGATAGRTIPRARHGGDRRSAAFRRSRGLTP